MRGTNWAKCNISEHSCLQVARDQKLNFCPIWTDLAISQVLYVQFFKFFARTNLVLSDWDSYINLIILTYIEHDFRDQKIKFLANLDQFGYIPSSVCPIFFFFFFAWTNLAINDWDWYIKLIMLTYIEHDFRRQTFGWFGLIQPYLKFCLSYFLNFLHEQT